MTTEEWLKELEEQNGGCTDTLDDSTTIEEILELFDENGNWKENHTAKNQDWDDLITELEKKYADVELPDESPSVEYILAMNDDNGNSLADFASKGDDIANKLGLSCAKLSSSRAN